MIDLLSYKDWINESTTLPKADIEKLRKTVIGKVIELVKMDDPHTKLKPGDKGVAASVDDTGTLFVKWDNGSSLGLVPGVDQYKVIE